MDIIDKTKVFVEHELSGAEGGHDWWHIVRVWKLSREIAKQEEVDMQVVELAALLHDIADSKFYDGDEELGPEKAASFLEDLGVKADVVSHVSQIMRNMSFRGGNHEQRFTSREMQVVQDADRLDAMGAIGIARAFNYGGFKGRSLYDPLIEPNLNMSKEEYKRSKAPTINHFYEKLLLLKDRMNTRTGRRLAKQRHEFMESFLAQFYREWDLDYLSMDRDNPRQM